MVRLHLLWVPHSLSTQSRAHRTWTLCIGGGRKYRLDACSPTIEHLAVVLPFAILAVAMWSPDFRASAFQRSATQSALKSNNMNIDDTMTTASIRQTFGSRSGTNFYPSWGTYIVPAAIAKRPIPAGALRRPVLYHRSGLGLPDGISAIWQPVPVCRSDCRCIRSTAKAGMEMTREGKPLNQQRLLCSHQHLWTQHFLLVSHHAVRQLRLSRCKERSKNRVRWAVGYYRHYVCCSNKRDGVIGLLPGIPAIIPSFR